MLEVLTFPGFLVTYALIQAVVFLLLARFVDFYQREPMWMIGFMALWGATAATMLSLVGNEAVINMLPEDVGIVYGAAIAAPLVEETAKGLALVVAFFGSRAIGRRTGLFVFEGVTDGIVYGVAIGLGFAFTEDIVYLLNYTFEGGLATGLDVYRQRVDLFGYGMLGHAIYTGLFGAGLGMATWSPSRGARIGFPALGLALGMLAHAAHNGIVSLGLVRRYGFDAVVTIFRTDRVPSADFFDFLDGVIATRRTVGLLFAVGFLLVIVAWLHHQRRVIAFELGEEVAAGVVSAEEAALAPAYWRRLRRDLTLLRGGRVEEMRAIRAKHERIVDLAFTKWRIRTLGGDWAPVEQARRRVSRATEIYRAEAAEGAAPP